MPVISIIIPVYNVEKYLIRCIQSVTKQTFSDLEIILVDDGSTDSSGKICDNFKQTDDRIKVIHKENGGLSSARNAGLRIATGDYIGFVDSDDWITPDMYEYLYGLIAKYDADLVSCDYVLADDRTVIKSKKRYCESVFDRNKAIYNYLLFGIIKRKSDYSVWKKLYKKKCFNSTIFPEGKLYEDMATNLEILQKCECYVSSSKPCYYYYQDSSSITRKKVSLKHLDLLCAANKINDLLKNENKDLQYLGQLQISKAYFSLLVKIARYGVASEMSNDFIDKQILVPFKKNMRVFMTAKFPVYMKIIALGFYINWNVSRKLLSYF